MCTACCALVASEERQNDMCSKTQSEDKQLLLSHVESHGVLRNLGHLIYKLPLCNPGRKQMMNQ